MLFKKNEFDTSNYDPLSPLFSRANAKIIGKFKDECGGMSPIEFVGLRAKMYSLFEGKDKTSIRTAKGVKCGFVD